MTGADVRGLDKTLGIPLIWDPASAAHAVAVSSLTPARPRQGAAADRAEAAVASHDDCRTGWDFRETGVKGVRR
jgi:hypothetical protein